jgi:hypothetical protein
MEQITKKEKLLLGLSLILSLIYFWVDGYYLNLIK